MPIRRRDVLTVALGIPAGLGLSACARRTATVAPPPGPPPAATMLAAAGLAHREGRTSDALALLAQTSDLAMPVDVRREALLMQGLLRLDPESPHYSLEAAWGLLSAARTLYDLPPLALVTGLHVASRLREREATLAALERTREVQETQAGTAAARLRASEEETRKLQRTVRALRSELEQREAALKKAADAVIGTPRR